MGTVKRFEELEVWKESRKLAKSIHECTSNTPFSKASLAETKSQLYQALDFGYIYQKRNFLKIKN